MKVRACMTTDPVAAQPRTRVGEALEMMTRHGLRYLPVMDEDRRFVGVVSECDVRAAMSNGGDVILDRGVLSVTKEFAPTLRGDDSVEDAWELLSRSPGLNPLPIVTDGRLEGTVSQRELLRAMGGLPKEPAPNDRLPHALGRRSSCVEDSSAADSLVPFHPQASEQRRRSSLRPRICPAAAHWPWPAT